MTIVDQLQKKKKAEVVIHRKSIISWFIIHPRNFSREFTSFASNIYFKIKPNSQLDIYTYICMYICVYIHIYTYILKKIPDFNI
jgi:hypothetical protein